MNFNNKNWKTTGVAAVLAFAALMGFVACNSSTDGGAGLTGVGPFGGGTRGLALACIACAGGDPEVLGSIVGYMEPHGPLGATLAGLNASYEPCDPDGFIFRLGPVEIFVSSDAVGSYDLAPGNAGGNWGRVGGARTSWGCSNIAPGGTFTICANSVADGISGTWAFTAASKKCSPSQSRFTAGTFTCVPLFDVDLDVAAACTTSTCGTLSEFAVEAVTEGGVGTLSFAWSGACDYGDDADDFVAEGDTITVEVTDDNGAMASDTADAPETCPV